MRQPNEKELKATKVSRIAIKEASAKIRTGPPIDDEEDYVLSYGAGEIPIYMAFADPIPDPRLREDHASKLTISPLSESHESLLRAFRKNGDCMKKIGLIGGVSWQSSAEYYRMINQEIMKRLGLPIPQN